MGYDLQKRLSTLQTQIDEDPASRLSVAKTLVQALFVLGVLVYFFTSLFPSPRLDDEGLQNAFLQAENQFSKRRRGLELSTTEQWALQTKTDVEERIEWLNHSWLGESTAEGYRGFAEVIFESFAEVQNPGEEEESMFYTDWISDVKNSLVAMILRLGFVFFSFWPLWLAGAAGGFIIFRLRSKQILGADVLGVCTRAGRLFYSGIYGPLRPNASRSGTDYSCPSLACPAKVSRSEAIKHPLFTVLREFHAANGTNLELLEVVLAYKNFPSFVEEERIIEDDAEANGEASRIPPIFTPISNIGDLTLEKSTIEELKAVLQAHRALQNYYRTGDGRKRTPTGSAVVEDAFARHFKSIQEASAKLSPLAQILIRCLVPSRAEALAKLPSSTVATACLALEAGKSLVFRREGETYIQISRFPHLQARAVLQSVPSHYREYKGDDRLMLRHAIICSRRHGDFGRALLPMQMTSPARALRDWLEILYAHPKKRADAASLTELDAHLEEIASNWRDEFARRLETERNAEFSPEDDRLLLWKGILFKSVALVPLKDIVDIALYGFSRGRLARVSELIRVTRRLHANLSISARLPGFKRQAEEAEKGSLESGGVTSELAKTGTNEALIESWLLIRRMLTRYNWLSTRVGDDAVPADGLVQGVVVHRPSAAAPRVVGVDALVPLRQRRFAELLGGSWERTFYKNAGAQRDVEVFVDTEEYREALNEKRDLQSKGLLGQKPRAAEAVNASNGS